MTALPSADLTPGLSRRSVLTAGALGGAAMFLAACGAGGGSATASGTKELRVGYFAFPSGDLVIKNRGLLEKALPDHKVTWIKFDSGASVNQAFIGKSLDIAALGSSPLARGLAGTDPIPYKVAFILDVAGENEALIARKDTGITDVAGLKGATIGTPFASTAHFSLLAALEEAGLGAADVKLVDLQPQAILAAWERKDIDAAYVWLPTLDDLRKTGVQLTSSTEIATAGKPTLDLAVVTDDILQRDPEAIDVWRRVEADALRSIKEDPTGAAQSVAAELGISETDAAAQLKQAVFLTPAELTSAEWLGSEGKPGRLADYLTAAGDFLAEQKQIDSAPTKQFVTDSLYLKGLPNVLG